MNFDEIPTYKVTELERKAIRILGERCRPSITIPVDIDLLVEQEPGVLLDIKPGLLERYSIAGMVVRKDDGTFEVLIEEFIADHRPNFYRFTVAEEFAHIILHRSILEKVTDIETAISLLEWKGYDEIDRNAKRFAAALLMPSRQLIEDARELYPQLVGLAGFNNPDAIKARLASNLSKKYLVSAEAMRHRLGEWPIQTMKKIDDAMREKFDFLD